MLVGTKTDLRDVDRGERDGNDNDISHEDGVAKAKELGLDCYMECSALKCSNLRQVYDDACRLVLKTRAESKKKRQGCTFF